MDRQSRVRLRNGSDDPGARFDPEVPFTHLTADRRLLLDLEGRELEADEVLVRCSVVLHGPSIPFLGRTLHSLLRHQVEVEPEVLEHVAQIESCNTRMRGSIVVCVFDLFDEIVGHLAGLLEGGIVEVGVELELVVAHGSILSLRG